MSRPSKPISKNSNSKFTPRNNKQDIFSRIAKTTKPKTEVKATEVSEENLEHSK